MRLNRLVLTSVIVMAQQIGSAQLHLLTGTTSEKWLEEFASALYRVEDDGRVTRVSEIVSEKVGTEWIGLSYDFRKAVILTKLSGRIIVVDFEQAALEKDCARLTSPGKSLIYSWLSDAPEGPSFDRHVSGADPKEGVTISMALDPGTPCEKSFSTFQGHRLQYVAVHGDAGIFQVSVNPPIITGVLNDGRITSGLWDNPQPTGYTIPQAIWRGARATNAWVVVADSHAFVLMLFGDDHPLLVFRKSDKTWRTIPVESEKRPFVRGFGKYIAITEVRKRSAGKVRSAGQEKWRKGRGKYGPDLTEMMAAFEPPEGQILPGRLHLYDVDTEKVYAITTNEGDSEVLLVENRTVYYRVNDKLYSAPIEADRLGPARLLAKDEVIRDAHWAFMKH